MMLLMPHFQQNLIRGSPTICSFNCLPSLSCPSFCCKVTLPMPSSCPSRSSVSCIFQPGQQPCCQKHYPPNLSTQSPYLSIAMWNSLSQYVPYCPASSEQSIFLTKSTPLRNVKLNFFPTKLCSTYSICPSSCSPYCSHSHPQYCYMDRQKSPYLLKTSEQTSAVEWSLAVQKADYESKVVLFQSRFLSSPLKICEPSYF